MPRLVALLVGAVIAVLGLVWLSGGFDQLAQWAATEQRGFQNQIARALRALRAGELSALAALLAVCFAYGFFHAVGPGHGKVLIGGYGLGRRVSIGRLTLISLAASLGQAITAVVLVYAGVLVLQMTRVHLVGAAEEVFAPVSYGAIAAIGLWLVFRATRRFCRLARDAGDDHAHGAACPDCGHRHGPELHEVEQAGTFREAAILIGGIAMRPCTGALFVLIITWQMNIAMAGVAGAVAMALGTAVVTTGVGWASLAMRGGLLAAFPNPRYAAVLAPSIELVAGLLIAVIAAGLLTRAI